MARFQNHFDIDDEFLIQRFRGGIKLSRPQGSHPCTTPCVADLLKMPFNVYFLDNASSHQALNELAASIMGFDSIKSTIGKSVFDISKKSGRLIRENDVLILKNKIAQTFEENLLRSDGTTFQTLTFKFPLYSSNSNVIGIFGCSIVLGQQSLADSLSQIIRLGLMNNTLTQSKSPFLPGVKIGTLYFTKLEKEILHFTVRGNTARGTANILGLSKRTVENYLDRIKRKTGVTTKSELIEKIISQGF